jgi:uncharacterized protein YbjQ (UPF0145 family)
MLPDWLGITSFSLSDPVVQKIVAGAAALIVLVILLRIISRVRYDVANARLRAELRREKDELEAQQEEARQLAGKIVATSSTARVAGYAIVRQIETVFAEAKPSSAAAVEAVKTLAVQKGANALVNLQSRQLPSGKWSASGDGVMVKLIERRGAGKA